MFILADVFKAIVAAHVSPAERVKASTRLAAWVHAEVAPPVQVTVSHGAAVLPLPCLPARHAVMTGVVTVTGQVRAALQSDPVVVVAEAVLTAQAQQFE